MIRRLFWVEIRAHWWVALFWVILGIAGVWSGLNDPVLDTVARKRLAGLDIVSSAVVLWGISRLVRLTAAEPATAMSSGLMPILPVSERQVLLAKCLFWCFASALSVVVSASAKIGVAFLFHSSLSPAWGEILRNVCLQDTLSFVGELAGLAGAGLLLVASSFDWLCIALLASVVFIGEKLGVEESWFLLPGMAREGEFSWTTTLLANLGQLAFFLGALLFFWTRARRMPLFWGRALSRKGQIAVWGFTALALGCLGMWGIVQNVRYKVETGRSVLKGREMVLQYFSSDDEAARKLQKDAKYMGELAKLLGKPLPASPIVVDATGSDPGTLGIAEQDFVRMSLRSGSDHFEENLRTLIHETAHVFLNREVGRGWTDGSNWTSFLHEGFAEYAAQRVLGQETGEPACTASLAWGWSGETSLARLVEGIGSRHPSALNYCIGKELFVKLEKSYGLDFLQRLFSTRRKESGGRGVEFITAWMRDAGIHFPSVLQALEKDLGEEFARHRKTGLLPSLVGEPVWIDGGGGVGVEIRSSEEWRVGVCAVPKGETWFRRECGSCEGRGDTASVRSFRCAPIPQECRKAGCDLFLRLSLGKRHFVWPGRRVELLPLTR